MGLTGLVADPVQSREHILIAQLLLHSWSRGKDMDLPEMIAQIQYPPLNKIGAFDIDTFYPEKDRLKLAIALNNILAAPSFSTWINGETLDLSQMMFTPNDKPRQLIFYIAHLEESQRQFFVTLLLEEVLNWTRKQPGTSTLRALLYFDEVFGYLPPHPGNPPTKLPLMTMLKQARAFGVGVLLATQNPVDLDYKALSNAGTWFVGKLQTERDKARLIEGLEGVAAEQGSLSNRNYLENVISSLGNRVFLLHNVHRGQPKLFQTRHALSFLRGPMTRDQVAQLMDPIKAQLADGTVTPQEEPEPPRECPRCHEEKMHKRWKFCPLCGVSLSVTATRIADEEFKQGLQTIDNNAAPTISLPRVQPDVPDNVPQYYLSLSSPARPADAQGVIYKPRLVGIAEVIFADRKHDVYHPQRYRLLTEAPPPGHSAGWHASEQIDVAFAGMGIADAYWEDVPESLREAKYLKSLSRNLVDYLYADARMTLYENKKLNLLGKPGEDVMTFLKRSRTEAQRAAETALADERGKYRLKFTQLGAKMPEGNAPQAKEESSMFTLINPLSWVGFGGKEKSPNDDKITRLENEWFAKQASVYAQWKQTGEEYQSLLIKPMKKNIRVLELGLAWAPFWQIQTSMGVEMVAAYR